MLDLSVDGAKATPVVLKETQRDPVRGETVHVDLLRVRLDQAIHAVVPLELTGTEDAPGVKEGGVLEQITRELNVEALPTAIPESIVHDVGEMQIGDHIGLADVSDPRGRDAARRPRGDGRRDPVSAPAAGRGGGGNRGRDGARRRGRGAGRGRGGRRLRGLLRRGVAPLRRPFGGGGGGGAVDWLIVGLGNPGSEYAGTPHNVGFAVADALAERWGLGRPKERFKGRIAEGRAGERESVPTRERLDPARGACCAPQTFMNDAGRSVGPARGSFKLPLERVLVVHDEIDLPFGEVRTRLGGGLAGHNGLKSIKRELGGAEFMRVQGRRGPAEQHRPGDRLGLRAGALSPDARQRSPS